MYTVVLVAIVLCLLFKALNVNNSPQKSLFYSHSAKFLEEIVKRTPSITEPYVPTRFWGFSGHVQTIIQGLISLIHCPLIDGRRYYFVQPDHTTVTYDLYQPTDPHPLQDDVTMALCPGICNSSESPYIKRVVHKAMAAGYRVAVLNHVGVLNSVPLTSARIFCYGNTADYEGMLMDLGRRYPGTKFVCVGFSMGGNLVTKFLGTLKKKVKERCDIRAGISICQGYSAAEAAKYLLSWTNFRRLYLFVMTENLRGILRRWKRQLFTEDLKREKGIVERDVFAAATLFELDDAYTRKIFGYDSVMEFYQASSSCNYFDGIDVPMTFLNAVDDPIVPAPLVDIIREEAMKRDNFLFIEQPFGGHLGFYEGGFLMPNKVTWLDRNVVALATSLAEYAGVGKHPEKAKKEEPNKTSLNLEKKAVSDSEDNGGSSSEDMTTPQRSPILIKKVNSKKAGQGQGGPALVVRKRLLSSRVINKTGDKSTLKAAA